MPQVQNVRLHTREQVEAIVQDAVEIANEYAEGELAVRTVFEKACDLLAASVPLVQQEQPISIRELTSGTLR